MNETTESIGSFKFIGNQLNSEPEKNKLVPEYYDFQFGGPQLHSFQMKGEDPTLIETAPYFDASDVNKPSLTLPSNESEKFYHTFSHELLSKLNTDKIKNLFDYYLEHYFKSFPNASKDDVFGGDTVDGSRIYNELKMPYSLYNWEICFHAPMQLVEHLLKSQQFDQAIEMCHYIFNPLANPDPNEDITTRCWQFPPFKEIDAKNVLEKLFNDLQPGKPDDRINQWRNKPFQPHVVARDRPSAYMKYVVMKYIEILIAYGDYYFRQYTNESIPLAIQCYVMASHLYGPRGQKIPRRGKTERQTYNTLLDKWDAFGNTMVEMELAFPFSNQASSFVSTGSGDVASPNIFGLVNTLYFCIPDNPNLTALRDTIDDRLLKIRACENIQGVFQQPPLFEPPIDPALLVQAAAQGLSLSSVLNDMNSPMPNYRFYYLLQKALELCSELKALGNAFLSAKEKGDAEALSNIRARHESGIQNLIMEVKNQQLEEANKALEALQQSRKGPVSRMQYYLQFIAEDLSKVPGEDSSDFSELPNQIDNPVDESGLKVSHYEKEEMDKASAAADWQTGVGAAETLASIFHALPIMHAKSQPLGVGADVEWGMPNLGHATQAIARGLKIRADHLSYDSSNAGRKAGFLRQLQDRIQQANNAGYEIKNIDKQTLTQKIRIAIANQEIKNQQQQIDNAQEVEDFLRSKYTNQELYSWMDGQIRTLYYQAYTLAYDMAKKAEKTYRFERGLSDSNFIQFGYWDAGRDGLLAGERLYIGLKQLEAAYMEKRGYDFEISKPISLRQINPLALLQLRETGTCEFALPEVLFDMDHPGHYMRRIKSVALTVPCVVGPYTSLNCTLRLLEHEFRTSAVASNKDYSKKTDEDDDRFSTVNVPIASIAVSNGQNDSGVFELNFKDERYIPFEGAGAMSKWRIELPAKFRQFDYDTITDVVMHLRYTAVDGGDKLKEPAAGTVQEYIKSAEDLSREEGLFAAFDLKHDFSNEWYKAMHPAAGATERVLTLNNLYDRLPIFTKGRKPDKILATDVYLITSAGLEASSLTFGNDNFQFEGGPQLGKMKTFEIQDEEIQMVDWQLTLTIKDGTTEIDKIWMLVRYKLLPPENG